MDGVVGLLRMNDPDNKAINIDLRLEPSDADLAQALEQNPFITDIVLNLGGVQQTDWNSLLRVIATRANLETVKLLDRWHRNAPAALVPSILRAIQQNTTTRTVELDRLHLPADISTFVDNSPSITSFSLSWCDMEPGEREQGARSLASLQSNTNIERLELNYLEDIYSIPILEGLQSNTSVKTFVCSPSVSFSDAAAHALQHLLESTTSIQRVEWKSASFHENQFRPIAQAMTSSECVSELKFSRVIFLDGGSIAQFQSILQNKRNLTSLCLGCCNFVQRQVSEAILSLLTQPDSVLRCFEFHSYDSLEEEFPRIQFENLLQAIQESRLLERCQIGSIETPNYLQALTQRIPSMKLKELEVRVWTFDDSGNEDEPEGEFGRETIRQELLLAAKNNFSLLSLEGKFSYFDVDEPDTDLFDLSVEDKERLEFYANRNKRLNQWVDNPVTVEQRKVWPEALGLAGRAGPNALFRGLRSVLERDYVSLPGGRKRKRPQYYAPS